MARQKREKKWSHKEVQELIHEEELIITYLKQLRAFWNRYWPHVLVVVVATVLIVGGVVLYSSNQRKMELDAGQLLQTARESYNNDQLDAAMESCEDIIDDYRSTSVAPRAFVLLGDVYLKGEQLQQAREAYQNYLNVYPRGALRAQVKRNLALVKSAEGKRLEAIEDLKELLAAGDVAMASDELRFYIGRCYETDGNYPEAQKYYEEIGEGSAWSSLASRRLDWLKAEQVSALEAS